jgi:hypothetical protein
MKSKWKIGRRLFYVAALSVFAVVQIIGSDLERRTFIFYTREDNADIVEERLFRRTGDRETDLRRYVEDALLGPSSLDVASLFPRETKIESFFFRNGVVYAALSQDAALPAEGAIVEKSLLTLKAGIKRNFSFVKDTVFFIGGQEALVGD